MTGGYQNIVKRARVQLGPPIIVGMDDAEALDGRDESKEDRGAHVD